MLYMSDLFSDAYTYEHTYLLILVSDIAPLLREYPRHTRVNGEKSYFFLIYFKVKFMPNYEENDSRFKYIHLYLSFFMNCVSMPNL